MMGGWMLIHTSPNTYASHALTLKNVSESSRKTPEPTSLRNYKEFYPNRICRNQTELLETCSFKFFGSTKISFIPQRSLFAGLVYYPWRDSNPRPVHVPPRAMRQNAELIYVEKGQLCIHVDKLILCLLILCTM